MIRFVRGDLLAVTGLLLLAACGGGGGGGSSTNGSGSAPMVQLAAVAPLFSVHGAKWNDYVAGSDWKVMASNAAACTATSPPCLHGGERRVVVATGKTTCTGLTAADDLGAFTWVCEDNIAGARLASTGLAEGKALSDLIDFTPPGSFKPNKVTVFENGVAWGVTPSSIWWTNVFSIDLPITSIAPSEIRLVLARTDVPWVLIAEKVALVVKPGVTIGDAIVSGGA